MEPKIVSGNPDGTTGWSAGEEAPAVTKPGATDSWSPTEAPGPNAKTQQANVTGWDSKAVEPKGEVVTK